MTKPKTKNGKGDTTAAGQALGFGLQYTQMAHMLLVSPEDSFVSFEVLDDVALHKADGTLQLIQSKSSLSGNPLSNLSLSLWKSLANWVDIIKGNKLDTSNLRLTLYVSKQVTGDLAECFMAVKNLSEADLILSEIKKKYYEEGVGWKVGEDVSKHMDRFFSDISIAKQVLVAFDYVCASSTPEQDLIDAFYQISPEKRKVIAQTLCGWVKNRVDELIRWGKPAKVDRNEFIQELYSVNKKYTDRQILYSLTPDPENQDQEELQLQQFVRQLDIIDLELEDKLEAIRYFHKASIDRTTWALDGQVREESFDELDSTLTTAWKNQKKIINLTHPSLTPEGRGQLLLFECMKHRAQVENCEAPSHFIPGCFHLLANDEALNLGWHPEYKELIKSLLKSKKLLENE